MRVVPSGAEAAYCGTSVDEEGRGLALDQDDVEEGVRTGGKLGYRCPGEVPP